MTTGAFGFLRATGAPVLNPVGVVVLANSAPLARGRGSRSISTRFFIARNGDSSRGLEARPGI